MDIDKLLYRIDIRREYLNGQKLSPEVIAAKAEELEAIVGIVCALEAAEEKEAEEELRREMLEEQQQEFE